MTTTKLTTEAKTNLREMIDELDITGPVIVAGWANDGKHNSLIFAKGTKEQLLKLNQDCKNNFES